MNGIFGVLHVILSELIKEAVTDGFCNTLIYSFIVSDNRPPLFIPVTLKVPEVAPAERINFAVAPFPMGSIVAPIPE